MSHSPRGKEKGCVILQTLHGQGLRRWNVQRGVIRVVTDSASNMVNAFNLPGFNEFGDLLDHDVGDEETDVEGNAPVDAILQLHADQLANQLNVMGEHYVTESNLHLRCLIHLLQLAIKDAIAKHSAVNSIINKTLNDACRTAVMPLSQRKLGKNINRPTQSKLSDFTPKLSSEASCEANVSCEVSETNTNTCQAMEEENDKRTIANLKSDFSSKLDGILSAIETVRKDVNECAKRVGEAEARISATEDSITTLEAKVRTLENNNKDLEDKVLDLEARSRRSNLRLVNLPEGAEGEDACVFLENWLPEVLNLERAHRVGQKSMSNIAAPRTMIMKFLNYKDKMIVIRAARAKGQILFRNRPVRFYEDLATGVHKKQKEFDAVRQQLRSMGIRYGMIPPARLIVTHNGQSRIFKQPGEAENFVKALRSESGQG
ncbi:LINE-1 type transposase domain-containing protein 1 [Labeo rohita]|uniref:LINE-1 type transposase domain-containing protein 1 n=1 Tax=Labeo rohita TaxID=84645 RepID=A0ABQ8L2I5_LABRO|nr:LINE-1 type transposase domain-containing protein 1 [Labeo rohita]